jgi:isopenicillin N synthase-like dioxygenase
MALECIDMSAPDKHTQAAQIREACLSAGFFYIVNHGIDRKLVEEVFAKSKAFFALPEAEKMKVFRDKNQRGYTPFDYEMLTDGCSKADTKESYYIGSTIPGSNIPFYAPNQFPSSEDMPGWKETMEQYYKELVSLCKRLASLFALALNLDESFFDQKGIIDKAASMMRLIHYNAEESSEEKGIYGVGAHCDWGFLTLLVTDDVPGLQGLHCEPWPNA